MSDDTKEFEEGEVYSWDISWYGEYVTVKLDGEVVERTHVTEWEWGDESDV